ncbi:hypothetical protein [Actinoplanes utahensis]|uniref:Uncharacterized protein n=1 Tax=Actinoplanes utahensis TaxID=1869 RepID=A0A0A6UMZ2_ACTUT|nr:hypothetical protein [Actinoplanes utahensis]KHD76438.1 hypothetical protein MB27_17160 [Actinoplanes utahensis]GIF29780.1 hypothetical protein Aut01nite_27660 [Actinoplanes utahensis]
MDLGRRLGDYAAGGVTGVTIQLLRRIVLLFFIIVLIGTVAEPGAGPSPALAWLITLVSIAYGARIAWHRLTPRQGIRRYYLHEGGLIETGLLGHPQDTITWADVISVREMGMTDSFTRLELHRHGAAPFAVITLGRRRELQDAVLRRLSGRPAS